jgi:diguanylate cyclase
MNAHLSGQQKSWAHDSATRLFLRFLSPCSDVSMAALQDDLQAVLNEIVVSTRDMADGVMTHSDALDTQIDALEKCTDAKAALQLVAQVLEETRSISQFSKKLVEKMNASAGTVERLNEELLRVQRDAQVDALTGVGNRARFDAVLERLIESSVPFGLILMDIDHFKSINDQHGHLIGDRVLRQLGKIMTTRTRATDVVTRFGGEEFAILLPETELKYTELVAEKLRDSIQKLNMRRTDTGSSIGQVTASFGVAVHCAEEAATELLARTDQALYEAKNAGRNRIKVSVQKTTNGSRNR